jgi:hypothetical protein
MNQAIRDWIRANRQPWRESPEQSILRGPVGSERALPLNSAALRYFEQRRVPVEGQLYEDLLEAELLSTFQTISSWLPADDRRVLDETVAFGSALTLESHPRTAPRLDGYAILFDYGFDTLIISATELYHALVFPPRIVSADEFPLALNTAIISVFFHIADYWSPIPDSDFAHRELVDRWVWLMSVFLLVHEVGHVMRNHWDDAPARDAIFRSHGDAGPVTVLRPAHRAEFEADQYAIELMFQGERNGGLMQPGADRKAVWNAAYVTLGWLFSIFGAIEKLAHRVEAPISDTHPPAAERWDRIDALIRSRVPIDQGTIDLERMMRANALNSAEFGDLPTIRKEMLAEIGEYVAMPYSALLAQLIQDTRSGGKSNWLPPSPQVFMAWINASTPEEARDILKQHPELLHPDVDEMHYGLANKQVHELARAHILQKRLPLLQRSREIGIDTAFEELAKGQLKIPRPPTPAFEIPLEKLRLFQTALAERDEKRIKELLESSPELAAFANLPETVMLLVNTSTPDDTKHMLETHPELLLPTADRVLADLAESQTNEAARKKVEAFRIIVARCRDFGISLANVITPAASSPGRIVLEADTDSGSTSLYARDLTDSTTVGGGRHLLLSPPWSVEPWLGRPLEVCIYRNPHYEQPVAFGTPAGFFWCVPASAGAA